MRIRTWAIAVLAALAMHCTDDEGAYKTLQSAGYSNIKIGGYSLWSCGKDDGASNTFTAMNPQGKVVSGVVCCGGPLSFKGCTIRF